MPTVPHSITVTIKRLTATEGVAGGDTWAYTTGARGAYPTSCDQVVPTPMSQQERLEYGVRGDRIGWKFFSYWNRPQVDSRDMIEWTTTHADGGTTTHQVKVIARDVEVYPDTSIYQWYGEDNSTED